MGPWRNVDKDSGDMTSANRSLQIHGLRTRKAQLVTVDSLSIGISRQAASASRVKRAVVARQVIDIIDWSKKLVPAE